MRSWFLTTYYWMLAWCLICYIGLALPSHAEDSHLLSQKEIATLLPSVGRLSIDQGDGFCTASLVSDKIIVTAAHCLFDSATGQPFSAEKLRFQAGWSAKDAAMVDLPRKLPLVVLSHGTGGASAQVSWLAEHLASNGYLVAAVNHHGNTAAEDQYAPQGFMLWWERARDLSVVIDKVIADPRFGQRVDSNRIVAGGFSLGGYSVLALAGARTNFAGWRDYCERTPDDTGCTPPPEAEFTLDDLNRLAVEDERTQNSLASSGHSYRDARVKAVYAIAPVLRAAFDTNSLENISIPVRLTVGSEDRQAVPELNAYPLQDSIPQASLRELPQVGHYTFLAPCTMRRKFFVSQLCVDESGIDRAEIHHQVAADALSFFSQTLDIQAEQ